MPKLVVFVVKRYAVLAAKRGGTQYARGEGCHHHVCDRSFKLSLDYIVMFSKFALKSSFFTTFSFFILSIKIYMLNIRKCDITPI